jgi:hypothetical protein
MKVLIPFEDTEGLASNLRYAGYDVIEHTDQIDQFALRCLHCDAVFLKKDHSSDEYHAIAIAIAHESEKPVVSWAIDGKGFVERSVFKFELSYELLQNIKPDHRSLPKILIVGPGRCGKDSLGEFIHNNSKHTYAGSTSKFLVKYVAECFRIPPEQAYPLRHKHRERWFEIGNATRENDHGLLQKEALAVGNVVAGIRDFREIAWACYNEIYDHIIWIDADVEQDPTLTFTANDIAVMLKDNRQMRHNRECDATLSCRICVASHETKFTRIKNNKDNQFFSDARKLIEAIG